MTAVELLREGKAREALAELEQQVRQRPAEPKLRIFLFQLLAVLGQWDRALNQLKLLSELDADCLLLAQIYRPLVQGEQLRADVLAGRERPTVFGEPQAWLGQLVQSNELLATGQLEAASEMRRLAFEEAPATPGSINGERFEWLADADGRLGPVLEVLINGRYYWLPFECARSIVIEQPTDLRDVVWTPASIQLQNGGDVAGHVPARYAGTTEEEDEALLLGRRTDWRDEGGVSCGVGQRLLTTDADDYGLLSVREIALAPAETKTDGMPGGSNG
jgi:type VI secretion system protein ImpE